MARTLARLCKKSNFALFIVISLYNCGAILILGAELLCMDTYFVERKIIWWEIIVG